jgi:transposase
MASLVAKTVRGRRYYQLVTCQRVNGQPRQVVLAHLGTADALLARLNQGERRPQRAQVYAFGLLAGAWQLAQQLEIVACIDRHVPKRRQGPSVGQYLLLAALNRLDAPTSKAGMATWYQQTALRRWLPIARKQLRSQRFWDHMNALDEATIQRIESDLSARVVEQFGLDLRCLCFDCTNFDTFVDSRTPAALPQRGHAKSKRSDLRVVGLALMVSTDFHVPLLSQVYPGNQPDAVTFGSLTEAIVERYRQLAGDLEHVTLVFDKGNNSEDNLQELAESPYHVVGSLVPSQHRDLLDVPLRQFHPCEDPRLEGVQAYRTTKKVFGHEWTIVVTRSEELRAGQLRGIAQVLRKRRRALATLQHKLKRSQHPGARGKGYTRASLEKHAAKLTAGQYVKELLRVTVAERRRRLTLRYHTDQAALRRLERNALGKRILFTDNHEWSTDEIILAYRSQHHVEAAFRQMKALEGVRWEPMYHWTDQKIRVHAFYCVLALLLATLLHRQAAKAGVSLSWEQLRTELSAIQEVITLHPSGDGRGGRPRACTTYTEAGDLGSKLAVAFDLDRLKLG